MLHDSVAAVVVVVVRTRPRAIPLAMITMRKSTRGFPFLSHDKYGAPLGGPSGRPELRYDVLFGHFDMVSKTIKVPLKCGHPKMQSVQTEYFFFGILILHLLLTQIFCFASQKSVQLYIRVFVLMTILQRY